MDGETASLGDEQMAGSRAAAGGGTDTTGKHRVLAELKRVEQESRFLEVFFLILVLFCVLINFFPPKKKKEICPVFSTEERES